MITFHLPGAVIKSGAKKPIEAIFQLHADGREDALWQAHHGVIEIEVSKRFPGARCRYDLRRLKMANSVLNEPSSLIKPEHDRE